MTRVAGPPAMKRLFILAFDHRTSLQRDLFGAVAELSPEQESAISEAKKLIFDGLEQSLREGVGKASAAILIDERFGAEVARHAREEGIAFALAVEKSGQKVFEFEYGNDFTQHIEDFDPNFCKALLRYNPEGDQAANEMQRRRLLTLSEWLESRSPQLMVELLVPAEPHQLASVAGHAGRYDQELRPALMRAAIEELQQAGVSADVWKIEGLDRRADCEAVAALTRSAGRDEVTCVVLGRGADDATVETWLRQAAGVRGYAGFAVGRTIWWDAVRGYLNEGLGREEATADISGRFRHFIEVYSSAE
jgi:myo-inositol catabolism protein IolC